MVSSDPVVMSTYELPPAEAGPPAPGAAQKGVGASLPEAILVRNVIWFCRFRWIVIAIFAAFGIVGLFPEIISAAGLQIRGFWPFAMAAVLTLCNVFFLAHARELGKTTARQSANVNLWSQIVLDLVVLTIVVHFMGGSQTPAPFAYLFHIVLACIFFSRPKSLIVTLIAAALYTACIVARETGIVTPVSIYADTVSQGHVEPTPWEAVFIHGFTLSIWFVVWYLASYLSAMVRQRDNELAQTNYRLVQAQKERTRHMLSTTHQLKAPFAAIHANAQLLLKGHCGELTTEALDVVQRISARCRRLTREIRDMLELANLRSVGQDQPQEADLDLVEVLTSCIAHVQPMALEHGLVFDDQLQPCRTRGVEDHLKMLFINLLSNAVTYSHTGGKVRVQCGPGPSAGAVVVIADEGIGIPAEKLPRIFEEYYRTDEAVRHNKESSGLGLAIVRHVAETHGIRIRVQSRVGAGTTFELQLPPVTEITPRAAATKEKRNGLRDDH